LYEIYIFNICKTKYFKHVQRDAEGRQTRKPPIVDVMGHRGGHGGTLTISSERHG